MFRVLSCLALPLLLVCCTPAFAQPTDAAGWYEQGRQALEAARARTPNNGKARNVILFVGDGMGVSTVTAARILEGQQRQVDGEGNRLHFETLPYLAHSVTASANQQTSDSAPTATAMVTGIKANDGALSVTPVVARNEADASVIAANSVTTILEQAEQRGMATGLVSTARITHATPAANYAHIGNRDWEGDAALPAGATVKDIARQLLEFPHGDGVDVVLGGGRSFFLPTQSQDPEYPALTGKRTDSRDLTQEWLAQAGARYVWNLAQFEALDTRAVGPVLGLFEPSHMKYEADRAQDGAGEPSLAEMTRTAIELLQQNANGYYLMVEAGRIDHAHHAGNAYRALTDTISLSEAVAVARELSSEEDTLIIVTADHSHVFTLAGYPMRGNPILGLAATEAGPMKDAMGLPYTTLGYANGPGYVGDGDRHEFTGEDGQYRAAEFTGDKAVRT
jgi:alkaline phosphatase